MTKAIPDKADVVIVGGGPGGLSCAQLLAKSGLRTVLLEKKQGIGHKICAGGVTWNGLLQYAPTQLIERSFPVQHIVSRLQHIQIREDNPIVATISRVRLGEWMAEEAKEAGALLILGAQVVALGEGWVSVKTKNQKTPTFIQCDHVVGADGARSLVRRFLQLPSSFGIGLNAMLPLRREQMEWHLDSRLFASGYAWIFPHGQNCSIGAYCASGQIDIQDLKKNLCHWAKEQKIPVTPAQIRAGWVNYQYSGLAFGHNWLVGEAAGLASALTGEGIYPALVSGQLVAKAILGQEIHTAKLCTLVARHARHRQLAEMAARHVRLRPLFAETLVALLRLGLLNFKRLEMADVDSLQESTPAQDLPH